MSPLDEERIRQKIAFIREQVNDLQRLVASSDRRLLREPWVLKGAKYALQTAIEAVIDIAYHLSAKKYGYPPSDARDALRVLETKGVVTGEDLPRFIAMIGFRNRLVHGYLEVSAERLEEIILYRLDDFEQFITAIVRDVFAGRQQDSD